MNSVARTLELSIASHSPSTPEDRRLARRADLETTPNRIRRIAGLAIDNLARDNPAIARRLLDGLASLRHMHYIGHGFEASVYLQGGSVVKVYRDTAPLSPAEKNGFAEKAAVRVGLAKTFLSPACIPQQYEVAPHPFGGYTVAVARQPYIAGDRLNFFPMNTGQLNQREVGNYLDSREAAASEVISFLDGAAVLHDDYGLMPDLNGSDNFRIYGGDHKLALIDPVPVAQNEHPGVYDLLLRQAEAVRDFAEKAL